mmetsp:Transcript_164291/g.522481  ORF Transcript_164291/g.522481 Transcript_164291/m.522481 type:complete len:147 (-) Transcript_164291:369-809(-)
MASAPRRRQFDAAAELQILAPATPPAIAVAMGSPSDITRDQFCIRSVAKERLGAAQAATKVVEWREAWGCPKESLGRLTDASPPLSARNKALTFRTSSQAIGSLARTGYIALLPKDPNVFVYDGYQRSARRHDPDVGLRGPRLDLK